MHGVRICVAQLHGGGNAHASQLGRTTHANTPHVGYRKLRKHAVLRRTITQIQYAPAYFIFLGGTVGNLRQNFGWTNSNRGWNARIAAHHAANLARVVGQVAVGEPIKRQERFVNAVHLQLRRELRKRCHHARGHIAVQRVVG